jgi:transposase
MGPSSAILPKAQKNDDRDAEAIKEAATRPTMRFVELKSEQQLDMQTLHRARDWLMGERTALINQLLAILMERGIVARQGRRKLVRELFTLIDEKQAAGVTPQAVKLIEDMRAQWSDLDRRIEQFDEEFAAFAKADKDARLLVSIPGIGVMIASALMAAVGKAENFAKGRNLAAWLGLVPKLFTSRSPLTAAISRALGQQASPTSVTSRSGPRPPRRHCWLPCRKRRNQGGRIVILLPRGLPGQRPRPGLCAGRDH